MSNQEKINVRFVVEKITHHNQENYFTVFSGRFLSYNSPNIPTSGTVMIGHFINLNIGDEFEGRGFWKQNPIFGWQFVLEEQKRILPSSIKGIKSFLTKFIKGVGEKNAQAIVDHFQENAFKEMEKGWETIVTVKGIAEKKARLIHESYMKIRNFEDVAIFVRQVGETMQVSLRIFEAFGEHSIAKIQENPYILCSIGLDFLTADRFAKGLKKDMNCPTRIEASVLYYLENQTKEFGHLYVNKEIILKELNSFLDRKSPYPIPHNLTHEEIEHALFRLTEKQEVIIEVEGEGKYVYSNAQHFIENRIVSILHRLLKVKTTPLIDLNDIEALINQYQLRVGMQLAEAQKDALYMALQNDFSILTGPPGTGKTQTINTVIECFRSIKPDALIELTAPTGKASKRMTELTEKEARTIHRLIGLNEKNEQAEGKKIRADLLIVDESSMIDAYVFYKLLESITSQTKVLLVGDPEQLPSVGAGLILRDLIASNVIPVTRLSEVFRQAQNSQIIMNAHAIISGDEEALTFDQNRRDCYFIQTNNMLKVQTNIITSIGNLLKSKRFSLDDIQVLAPVAKGDLGVDDLNRLIQNHFNPRSLNKKEYKFNATTIFRKGDKVMQTVNNYDLGVMNGEVGRIVEIEEDGEDTYVTVDFGDKQVEYNTKELEELVHAYAITIHKSQGSEFKCVIMPIHESQEFMLNKNLIYTAITRAKDMICMIGQKKVLHSSMKKTDNTLRNSRIKEKLLKTL